MKTIITEEAARNILKRRYEYYVAGIVNGIKDGTEHKSHTFNEAVKMISDWLIADIDVFDTATKEGIKKVFKGKNLKVNDLVSEWLRRGIDLEWLKKYGWISEIKSLEDEIETKELELNMLKLRYLKAKLSQNKQEDVTFGDIEIMREIIRIWDKK